MIVGGDGFADNERRFMARALELAQRGLYSTDPNPRVGCVIVKGGEVIGEGSTQPPGGNHAEVEAIIDARARGHDPRGSVLYVCLEPCSHFGRTPPCANALIEAGIARQQKELLELVAEKFLTSRAVEGDRRQRIDDAK